MSFQDKVVIVTGSSSGIGAAIAVQFAEEGAKVAIVGRKQEKLNNVAKKCGKPLVLVADVSKDEDAKRIVDETLRAFGKIDILVNNAGIGDPASIQSEHAMAVFDKVMTTNLRSAVYLTHLAAPHLVKTKGNIVNISSVAAFKAISKDAFAYCASKAALDHFTRAAALELASSGVRVNTINPGPVLTDVFENMGATREQQAAFFKGVGQTMPLKRVSIPEEIGDLVLFLASEKARAITGSNFVSDNGAMLGSAGVETLELNKAN
ncbi:17-beta-hydroxysteroid dehydrogenase 14-like [Helicoverpa zea]|uniref:17-beta-hydroxysteroid dehydrogenase 14-like n=1 Tax=Helicoverpa zea TaxID=7113 RepID=UPI001F5A9B93|nr:17-beta-hydroxysteroid dehydrogenase 14-like [Helicoverpa zea]